MIKVAHLGDVHIHNLQRHDEYRIQFDKIYDELRIIKPDRIVIAGDLFEEFVSISNEAKDLAGEFLNNLASIAKVILVVGNHDIMKKNKNRLNSVITVVRLLKNDNIMYLPNTNFFEDDNFVWVNYSHLEKNIDPWKDIKHTKNETKLYIAIFHDPINGSKTDTGATFKKKKYKPIAHFDNNDFVLLADIHKRQYFRDDKSAAYCGSTIQQNFGENIEHHGFLVWNIENPTEFTIDEHNIPNDHNYINFTIKTDTDYDNLELDHRLLNPQSEVKIKWEDISAKVNFENEIKIRNYFKEAYGITNIRVVKNSIYTDVNDVEMVNESIDVLNLDNQRKIFTEYLMLNGYEKEFIDEILKIDDIINDRLNIGQGNLGISWSIDKFWFNNFKSYADDNMIDWENNNGVYQVSGVNQQGKTTILDAICYILYGKTTTTLKREKNGDNRYINNKRDLNYCNGGAVITINNDTYTIIRETERKINRDKTGISSCSTNVEYYLGTDLSEENKLTGERKSNTQETIDNAIGDFSDFIRLVLTTADNLNELLSMDRATFMDAIIKDAGYDIFENKLIEFKEYRKEITKNRITINIDEHNDEIYILNESNHNINLKLDDVLFDIEQLEESKPSLITNKDKTIEKLEKIDESLYNFDLTTINESIISEQEKLTKRNSQLIRINEIKEEVKDYSSDELTKKTKEQTDIKDLVNQKNSDLKDYDIKITNLKSKINTYNSDIKNSINSYVTDLKIAVSSNETKISKLKEDFNNRVITLKSTIKDELNSLNISKTKIKGEIDLLMEQGKNLKNDTDELENSLDKVCITCNRTMDESSVVVVNQKISTNKSTLMDIMSMVKHLKPKMLELDQQISELTSKVNSITIKEYEFDLELKNSYGKTLSDIADLKVKNENIEKSIELIKNDNIPNDLKITLETFEDKKKHAIDEINIIDASKIKLSKEITIKTEELETLKDRIKVLSELDNAYKKNMEIILVEDKVKLDIEKLTNTIEKYNTQIETYNKQIDKIANNIKIKADIDVLTEEINTLDKKIKDKNKTKSEYESELLINNYNIKRLTEEIQKFEEQKRQDEIYDSYMKCVHRDGLPSFLLKKSIHIINQELNNILTDVDFVIFFDEDLNVKLSHNIRLDVSQNAIESSGKERTFASVALKIALRKINNKSKPNICIFDEIMGKLVDNSVEEFIKLLETIKNEVDKLIIIEHIHTINYDYLITVNKDEDGISTLAIE